MRKSNKDSVESFIEELVVRRELSDNFCWYNQNYDNLEASRRWRILWSAYLGSLLTVSARTVARPRSGTSLPHHRSPLYQRA